MAAGRGARRGRADAEAVAGVVRLLSRYGFAAQAEGEDGIKACACPFEEVAFDDPERICGLDRAIWRGDAGRVRPRGDPSDATTRAAGDEACVVHVTTGAPAVGNGPPARRGEGPTMVVRARGPAPPLIIEGGPDPMGIIGWIAIGLIAGGLAKLILPGKQPGGIIVTCLIGIAGAFIAGGLARLFGFGDPIDEFWDVSTWVGAIIGAVLLLLIWGWISRMDKGKPPARVTSPDPGPGRDPGHRRHRHGGRPARPRPPRGPIWPWASSAGPRARPPAEAVSPPQRLEGVPDLGVGGVQRGRAEAQDVRAGGSRRPPPRAASAARTASASAGASATCAPRRAGSRGEASRKPRGASRASTGPPRPRSGRRSAPRSRSIPASSTSATPSSTRTGRGSAECRRRSA